MTLGILWIPGGESDRLLLLFGLVGDEVALEAASELELLPL